MVTLNVFTRQSSTGRNVLDEAIDGGFLRAVPEQMAQGGAVEGTNVPIRRWSEKQV